MQSNNPQGAQGAPGQGKPGQGKPGQGKPGQGRPGQGRQGQGKRGQGKRDNQMEGGLEDNVVRIYRCATVVKGGRRFSFAALTVVGDRKASVGMGYGKAAEVPSAVEKSKKIAQRGLTKIKLRGKTIPHRTVGRFGAARVVLIPASPGTGVIAGASVRSVLELAGVHDCLTKCYGSRNPKNLVRATYEALVNLYSPEKIEELRGVKIAAHAFHE